MKQVYLAGGCFWGIQTYLNNIKGVVKTTVGYANSIIENPSYEDVCSEKTGATEACEVYFNENILSLEKLLNLFFKVIDPTALNYQGNDRGTQYRTGIYYTDHEDKKIIEKIIKEQQKQYFRKIVTEVMLLKNYYLAEEYHQNYLEKNPNAYCHIPQHKIDKVKEEN